MCLWIPGNIGGGHVFEKRSNFELGLISKGIAVCLLILTISIITTQAISAQEDPAKASGGDDIPGINDSAYLSLGNPGSDYDNDGLTNIEEEWWHCNPMDNDTNDDSVMDGPSVDYANPERAYPYNGTLDEDLDRDHDGLPTAAEINDPRLRTDSGVYSTDGDPYGDGDEYFGVGIPEISPADHPLVAAYPNLKVVLSKIRYTPTGEITATREVSNQSSWSSEAQNGISSTNTNEFGVGVSATIGASTKEGVSGSATVSAHYTTINEYGTESSITQSSSGFTENDWSTADTIDKERAAIVTLIFNVKNIGTAPAQDIEPYVNLLLGDQEIAAIGSLKNITSLPAGSTSKNLVIEEDQNQGEIALSLDELKSIERGSPLNIETFEINAKAKNWDNNINKWVLIDQDFSLYMDEINKKTATLIVESEDGTRREFKVAVFKNMTLGEALDLTVGSNMNISHADLGFPKDAEESIMDLAEDIAAENETAPNETADDKITIDELPISNLILKKGWVISIRPQRDNLKISWASYDERAREVSASVTGQNEIKNVLAHIKVGDGYQDWNMTSPGKNTIYLLRSDTPFEIDENCFVKAKDIGNNSLKVSLSKPTRSSLENGQYLIIANNSEMAMECSGEDEGYNVIQNDCIGDLSQIWNLQYNGDGLYSIQNEKYSYQYLEVDESKSEEGANVQGGVLDKVMSASQQWHMERDERGNYAIIASHSGKRLTVSGNGKGASIVQESDQQKQDQKWIVQLVESYPFDLSAVSDSLKDQSLILTGHNFRIASDSSNGWRLLGVHNNSLAQAPEDDAPDWAFWRLLPSGDGYFALISNNTSSNCGCLQVAASNLSHKSNGIEVNAGCYSGQDNQKWRFKHIGGDQYAICSKYSNKCLDISPQDANNLRDNEQKDFCQQWVYQGRNGQKFSVITPPPVPEKPGLHGTEKTTYEILVSTANDPYSGTDAKISINLIGENGTVKTKVLGNRGYNDFKKGAEDKYRFNDTDVGDIIEMQVVYKQPRYILGFRTDDDWHVEKIEITNMKTKKKWTFAKNEKLMLDKTYSYLPA
jgi:hypothetical protein